MANLEVTDDGDGAAGNDAAVIAASAAPPQAPVQAKANGNGQAHSKSGKKKSPSDISHPRPESLSPMGQLEREDEKTVVQWLNDMGGDTPIRINIARQSPRLSRTGMPISGSLETVDRVIDDEYIRETWGGGEFMIKLYTQNKSGSFSYLKGRTVKIGGEPKMQGRPVDGSQTIAAPIMEDSSLSQRAFEMVDKTADRERQRAERLEEKLQSQGGADIRLMQEMAKPLYEQIAASQKQIAELQVKIIELSTKPPPRDEFRDSMMMRALDGEGKAVDLLRTQYEARIDKLNDNHDDQLRRITDSHAEAMKRIEDRHASELRAIEARHERELRNAEKTAELNTRAVDMAAAARIDSLKDGNGRYERELGAAQAKIAVLEAKKDQSISDKADELIKVKEALDGIGGGSDATEEKWYEKIMGIAANSGPLMALANKFAGGPPGPGQPGQQQLPPGQQLPPIGMPFSTGDGNVYVREQMPNGQVVTRMVNQQQLRQQRNVAAVRAKKQPPPGARAPANASAAAEAAGGDDGTGVVDEALTAEEAATAQVPAGRPPDAAEMTIAVNFMETACRNGTDPAQFAATARNMIPSDILVFLQHVGFERFIANAKLDGGSPLATMNGKGWIRKVSKALTEGA